MGPDLFRGLRIEQGQDEGQGAFQGRQHGNLLGGRNVGTAFMEAHSRPFGGHPSSGAAQNERSLTMGTAGAVLVGSAGHGHPRRPGP